MTATVVSGDSLSLVVAAGPDGRSRVFGEEGDALVEGLGDLELKGGVVPAGTGAHYHAPPETMATLDRRWRWPRRHVWLEA